MLAMSLPDSRKSVCRVQLHRTLSRSQQRQVDCLAPIIAVFTQPYAGLVSPALA